MYEHIRYDKVKQENNLVKYKNQEFNAFGIDICKNTIIIDCGLSESCSKNTKPTK